MRPEPIRPFTYPLVLDSIGKVRDSGGVLHAHCEACNRHSEMDMDTLIERLGYDHSCMAVDLCPKLRCSRCGSRKVSITHSNHWGGYHVSPSQQG